MSEPAECPMCHQPTRSDTARRRGGIGEHCWRKLAPAQRAAIRYDPRRVRAVLTRPVPVADTQLQLED
ncbi:hypothetical protein [Streptomyces chartreusis]|uniref:hypothetical protein n=1 Tax=Streptomyces chartreusis TaxID=1969 RepID=UPI0037F43D58